MKSALPFILILAVALGAIAGGTMLYRAKREAVFAPIPGDQAATEPGAKPPHFRGSPQAKVVLEEFGDLQCPPCALLSKALKKIEQDYEGRLRVIFRHFPLAMHKHAVEAARATEAAGAQKKFWEMSDMLYENQATWSKEDKVTGIFEDYARKIGLDMERYKADLESNPLLGRIGLDNQRGVALGVTSTPTLFLNNQRVPVQSMSESGLRTAIDAALKGEQPFPTPTPTPPAAPSSSATPELTPTPTPPPPTAS